MTYIWIEKYLAAIYLSLVYKIFFYFQATLRKIVDCSGPSVISPQDAQELVEPRLLDSFLAYSAQNESYV